MAGEHGIASEEEGESARVCSEPAEYVDSIPPHVISLTSNESDLGAFRCWTRSGASCIGMGANTGS